MIFVNRRNRNNSNRRNSEFQFNQYFNINIKPAALPSDNIGEKHNITINQEDKKKEMLWGEPTWFFFHTLAEKIKDEYFNELFIDLIKFVKLICSNLPCPDCAKHATSYMNKINFDAIKNKEQLKMLFFKFHNEVNKQKEFPLFEYTDLKQKYSSAITLNIIKNFFYHYSRKNFSVRLDTSNYQRMVLLKQLKVWLETHHYCFEE